MACNQRILLRITLFVVLTMFMGLPVAALAQGKKGKGTKTAITLQIYKDKGGKYRYRLKNEKGKSLAIASSGVKSKDEFMDRLKAIQKYAAKAKILEGTNSSKAMVWFQIYQDKGKKFRFRIKGAKGASLGRSSIGYETKAAASAVIAAIQKAAATAKLVDDTK